MKTYTLKLTGTQPLLMHSDNIEWADQLEVWKNDVANKKLSKPGDDRTPSFRWIGCLYHDTKEIVLPISNIMRAGMEGGALVLVPGGRSGKTFKAQSQSGIMPREISWPFLVNGKTVPFGPIAELMAEPDFMRHKIRANELGFDLFVRRARIGAAKHIRVRPRFEQWSVTGDLVVTDSQITESVLRDIFECAGRFKGLCDWRPGSKTPGTFGMFSVEIWPK